MPAQVQSFLNPLPYLPAYAVMKLGGPLAATAVLAAFHGLTVPLSVVLARHDPSADLDHPPAPLARPARGSHSRGVTAPMFVSEIGTTFADVSTSTLILGGLALVIGARNSPKSTSLLVGAGLAFGAATGLKLTNAVFVFGLAVTLVAGPELAQGRRWGCSD